jgi:NADPH-dependent 2,4-dienoyl-CoA reductase/sulfur reductase-like enzyme
MSSDRLVVAGASLAGLRAVESARRNGFDGLVTLIGAEPHLPYDRPPLSKKFLTDDAEPAYFRTEDSLRSELGVDLRLGVPVTALDVDARTVTVGGEDIAYTAAILATGAAARELPGTARLRGVHTLRGIDDARDIRAALVPGAQVVIIGGGFVGVEFAYAARHLGVQATVVEGAPVPLTRAVGADMGAALARQLSRNGIALRCGSVVESIEGAQAVESVRLADGSVLPADLVVVGIGAVPQTSWLAGSGLKLDDGIVCDETLGTSAPGVYAAGDVARWFNPLFGESMRLENWTTAAEQGVMAGRNAINPAEAAPFSTVPYFWSDSDEITVASGDIDSGRFLALYRQGDRVIGALGLNERRTIMRLRTAIAQRATWLETLQ